MKKIISIVALTILANTALAITSTEFVKNEANNVLLIVQKNKELKNFKEDLNNSVDIERLIDFQKISKMTLGIHWRNATEAQRVEFTKEFKELLVNFYGNAMFGFKDATIDYKKETENGDLATVKTIVSYSDHGQKTKAKVDYILVKDGESWKMVDIVIEGINLTLSYKGTFAQIIGSKGMDGLILELKQKNTQNNKPT
jgi:phospholipid transport system substrate-binding protein